MFQREALKRLKSRRYLCLRYCGSISGLAELKENVLCHQERRQKFVSGTSNPSPVHPWISALLVPDEWSVDIGCPPSELNTHTQALKGEL